MPSSEDTLFGEIAVEKGLVTPEQVEECVQAQKVIADVGISQPLGQVMLAKGCLTKDALRQITREAMQRSGRRIKVGPYEVVAKLGQGGMGAVYKAEVPATGAVVAIKVLPPDLAKSGTFVERFRREANVAAQLDHPNIVRAISAGESGGYHYFAMEFVEGESVGARIKRQGPIPEPEAFQIVRQMALALQHAADAGLIHRDIKPDNIFLTPDGQAKLGDLGLARETGEEGSSLTQAGMMIGTPHYVSPEQAKGARDVDTRSDIYSLGATLYHMVTGEVPFKGDTSMAVLSKHLNEELPWPADLNDELSDGVCSLISKMMAKDREDRYQEPLELVAEIDRVIRGEALESRMLDVGRSSIKHAAAPRAAAASRRQRAGIGSMPTPATARSIARGSARMGPAQESRGYLWMGIGAAVVLIAVAATIVLTGPGDEPTAQPEERPPAKVAKELPKENSKELYERTVDLWKANPEDYDGAVDRFTEVRRQARGTVWSSKAAERIDEVREARRRSLFTTKPEEPVRPPLREPARLPVTAPAQPAGGRIDLGGAEVIWRSDFEADAGGWTGRPEKTDTPAGRSGVLVAGPLAQDPYDAVAARFACYHISKDRRPYPGLKLFDAAEDVHISFRYHLSGTDKIVVYGRNERHKLNLRNDVEKASQDRWTAVVLDTMKFSYPWKAGTDTAAGDTFSEVQLAAGTPGQKDVRLVIDDFAITKGPRPRIVATRVVQEPSPREREPAAATPLPTVEEKRTADADRRLDEALDGFESMASRGLFAGARQKIAEAKGDKALAGHVEILQAAERVAGELVAAEKVAQEGLAGAVGKSVRIKVAGKPRACEITAVHEDAFDVEREVRMGGRRTKMSLRVKFKDIDPEELAKLKGRYSPESPDGHVAAAILALGKEDVQAAEACLGRAGEHPLVARYRRKIDEARLGAREVAAREAWSRSVARLVKDKLKAREAKRLLAALKKFEADHGGTRFAAGKAGEIARLEALASQGEQKRVLLVDWGSSPDGNVYGTDWRTVAIDVYSHYSSAGPKGIDGSDTDKYNYQCVRGRARVFSAGQQIAVTWHNNHNRPIDITPRISFDDPDRRTTVPGTWYDMTSVTVPVGGSATTTYTFTAASAGTYSLVNVNGNYKDPAEQLVCDKFELVTGSVGPVAGKKVEVLYSVDWRDGQTHKWVGGDIVEVPGRGKVLSARYNPRAWGSFSMTSDWHPHIPVARDAWLSFWYCLEKTDPKLFMYMPNTVEGHNGFRLDFRGKYELTIGKWSFFAVRLRDCVQGAVTFADGDMCKQLSFRTASAEKVTFMIDKVAITRGRPPANQEH